VNGIAAYTNNTILTQSRSRLVVMLYEGAIKFLRLAIRKLDEKDYAGKGYYINKAQDIINELNAVLNIDSGGEMAVSLRKLYVFMVHHLSEANVRKDAAMIKDVIDLLEELLQGWNSIAD
jgi:flagellar secretion chaperone FliS